MKKAAVVSLLVVSLLMVDVGRAQLFRPEKEIRSLNTARFELIVQKSGQLDIFSPGGAPLVDNAHPRVLFAGEKEPEDLPVHPKYSGRSEVNERIGQGHGFILARDECEWRIQAFVTQPFMTFQVVYKNDSKKPVTIEKLYPFYVGEPDDGYIALGANASETRILENGRLFQSFSDYAEVVRDRSSSQWNLAAHNPAGNRTVVAGFLSNEKAYTQVVLERTDDADQNAFDVLRAECVYDPPVTVPPGESLTSEIFYLAPAEDRPIRALERYGKAYAVVNEVRNEPPLIPHGWDSWSTAYGRDISQDAILKELDVIDSKLKRYGWNHLAIDAGWAKSRGDWEPNPEKFPNGMKWIADQIHERGMTAGLWLAPFTVNLDSEFAKAHPDWLLEPNPRGVLLLGDNVGILDVTIPEAWEHVRQTCAKISRDWGYDALMEADFVYHLLLADGYSDEAATRVEVLRRGLAAVRDGFGADKFIMTMTPHPISGIYSDGVRVGLDCRPIWKTDHMIKPWGAVDTLTNAIRRFYFTPHLYIPDQDCAFFGHESSRKRWDAESFPELTWNQSLAWLTGAALTGGAVKIGERFSELSDRELGVLRKLLPSVQRPARPLDLFQEESPQIWHLPLNGRAGRWDLLALFNWDAESSDVVSVPLTAVLPQPDRYVTVYDFWNERYFGTARGKLEAEVESGSVRLFGLRYHRDRPMLLASDRHIAQGALDHSSIDWNAETLTLAGTFDAVANTDYALRILVPERFTLSEATVPDTETSTAFADRVLILRFHAESAGSTQWRAQFTTE